MGNLPRFLEASRIMVVAMTCCWLFSGGLMAQEDENKPESRQTDLPLLPDVLKEGTLELKARLYLPDGKGEPRFVPNMRLGDLLDMVRAEASRREGADLPAYAFDEFTLDARIGTELADIKAQATITLSENTLPVTTINLRMQACQLSEPISFEGEGKSQWQVSRSEPGYTWWLRAPANTTHRAKLSGQTVLITEGDRQSLQLALPAAPTTISAILPAGYQDVRVRGQGGELLRSESLAAENRVVIRCVGGDVNISWRKASENPTRAGAAEVTSKTRIRIDDPREAWESETDLALRSYGDASIESLLIDLPEGAQWLPSASSVGEQFTIAAETISPTESALKGDANTRPHVRLTVRAQSRLGLAAVEAITVRWRWTPARRNGDVELENIQVPALSVQQVDRHEGTTLLAVSAAYGLEWRSQQGTELLQQSRVLGVQEQAEYLFRFARQPQGLLVSFRREVQLADVRPIYVAEIDRGRVKLTGWLQCVFDRSQRPELALQLGEWQLDSAQSISDFAAPYAEGEVLAQTELPQGMVKLSASLDWEASGNARKQRQLWRVVAYRNLTEGSIEHLQLVVPTVQLISPDGSATQLRQSSGVLLVSASDNVLVSWDERGSKSLLADTLSREWVTFLPQSLAENARAFRFQSNADGMPTWAGRMEVLPRRIVADQAISVRVDAQAAQVTQRFTLQIANEPLAQLVLLERGAKNLVVLVEGIPCALEPVASSSIATNENQVATLAVLPTNSSKGSPVEPEQALADGMQRWRILGTPRLLGKISVEVRSLSTWSEVERGNAEFAAPIHMVELELPEASLGGRPEISVTADRRLNVSLVDALTRADANDGRATEHSGSSSFNGFIAWPQADQELELNVRRLDELGWLPVHVTGAWMQTALSGSTRMDRFCARIKTEQASLVLKLPNIDLLGTQVAIDGVNQTGVVDTSAENLQINLRDLQPGREHTLEVWTWSAIRLGWLNAIDVVPVSIEGCERYDHFYWQLVTPPGQHLVMIPDSVTPEWNWTWSRFWWQRTSPNDQDYFENWLAATPQAPLAESARRYVVSTYGPVPEFRCWVAARVLLWLPAGLLVLVTTLLLSLWPVLRHPAILIVVALSISGLALVWSDLAVLLAQTSMVALLIVLLYALAQAAVESRVRRRSVFTSRPATSLLVEASDHASKVRPTSHASSEVIGTTRTQTPLVADSGGP